MPLRTMDCKAAVLHCPTLKASVPYRPVGGMLRGCDNTPLAVRHTSRYTCCARTLLYIHASWELPWRGEEMTTLGAKILRRTIKKRDDCTLQSSLF